MDMVLIGLAAGVVVGAVVGLVGAGGAIIAVPALVYVVGLSPEDAVPTSLIVVGLAAVAGALPRLRHDVSWPLVLVIGLSGIPASWAGAALGSHLDEDWLMVIFAGIMIVAGARMVAGPAASRNGADHPQELATLLLRGIPTGLLVGFLTGLLGVGGGFLIVPALTLLLRVPMSRAIGTSLVIIAINSASGFAAHLGGLSIDWPLTASFAAAAVAASLAAARASYRLNDAVVTRVFAVIVFAVALGVLLQSVPAVLDSEADSRPDAPPADMSASLAVSRLSAGERSINMVISNGTDQDLAITAARLETAWYESPAQWVPADGNGTTVRPGGRVALPAALPAALCANEADEHHTAATIRLTLGDGSRRSMPASDPSGSLAGAHGQDCLKQTVDRIAPVSLPDGLDVAEDGRSATVSLTVAPTGMDGSFTLESIGTTTLVTEAPGLPWPRQTEISGQDQPSVLTLHIVPQRCDDHALAEDKVGTRLPLTITAADLAGQVRLEPSTEFTAAVYRFVRTACGAG